MNHKKLTAHHIVPKSKEWSNNRSNIIKYKWKSLKKYCEENNLKYYTIWNRIKRLWWDIEKAINT